MPRHFSGDIKYHIMNGHFYTNFDQINGVPSKIDVKKRKNGKGILYKIDKNASIRIGKGGPEYSPVDIKWKYFFKT